MAKKSEIRGMKELERTIKQLGQLPQKCVTKASRKGATVVLKAAKANAPVDEGNLKKGIVLKGERSRIKGKKVYQVTFDRNMNDVFVKESEEGKRSYYPASQEFGFMTRNGGYVPGYRYLRQSIDGKKVEVEKTTVDVLAQEIDKLK
jgi:HK97 gp10 family phage protein